MTSKHYSTNLPALDHTVHQLNSRSPPSWDQAPPQGKQSRLRLRLQGRQHIYIQQEEALPGISNAHCTQTLIPHMPVPPQESAPSLSPRQSFGCQSPLPWVTGTDRTGILWALWQLQEFLPGVLFFPCALPHLEGSLAGQQASRSPVLRNHNISRENTDKAFQKVQLSQDNFTG
jgi:hypothetical protein